MCKRVNFAKLTIILGGFLLERNKPHKFFAMQALALELEAIDRANSSGLETETDPFGESKVGVTDKFRTSS